jgi:hypothetical protein
MSTRTRVARTWREPISDRWAAQSNGKGADTRSQGDRIVDAYWRLNDPMPWVHMMRDLLALAKRFEIWRKKLGLSSR